MAQVQPSFNVNVNSGCTPLAVTFTNTSDSGGATLVSYDWDFGNSTSSTKANPPTVTYNNGGVYTATLTMTNVITPSDNAQFSVVITVNQTVNASLSINKTDLCVNEWLVAQFSLFPKDSVLWEFGDGEISRQMSSNSIGHQYKNDGNYTLKYTTYNKGCSDFSETPISVGGPKATFSLSEDSVCLGEQVTFTVSDEVGVNSFEIIVDEADQKSPTSPFSYSYVNPNNKFVKLKLTGPSKSCTLSDTVHVYPIDARIETRTAICALIPTGFVDVSDGLNLNYYWDMGDGSPIKQDRNLSYVYAAEGEYVITHWIENPRGCSDTIIDSIYAPVPPDLQLGKNWVVCQGQTAQLEASGGDSIFWDPAIYVDSVNSYTPVVSPPITTFFRARVKDSNTQCERTGIITVTVQPKIDWASLKLLQSDSLQTLIIGETANIEMDSTGQFTYLWSPEYRIKDSCLNCAKISVQPLETATYQVIVTDTNNCFSNVYQSTIEVEEKYQYGLAKAFTPNNDGTNDVMYVNGWGIKELIEFRVFNRHGNEVYFSNNLEEGWDGMINGKFAPVDSYGYIMKAELWDGRVIVKNGKFSLIR